MYKLKKVTFLFALKSCFSLAGMFFFYICTFFSDFPYCFVRMNQSWAKRFHGQAKPLFNNINSPSRPQATLPGAKSNAHMFVAWQLQISITVHNNWSFCPKYNSMLNKVSWGKDSFVKLSRKNSSLIALLKDVYSLKFIVWRQSQKSWCISQRKVTCVLSKMWRCYIKLMFLEGKVTDTSQVFLAEEYYIYSFDFHSPRNHLLRCKYLNAQLPLH